MLSGNVALGKHTSGEAVPIIGEVGAELGAGHVDLDVLFILGALPS